MSLRTLVTRGPVTLEILTDLSIFIAVSLHVPLWMMLLFGSARDGHVYALLPLFS